MILKKTQSKKSANQKKCALLTIGVPTFQREKLLLQKAKNLAQLSFQKKLIIISSNSPLRKATEKKLKIILRKTRYQIYVQKKNIGAWQNFLFLLKNTKSKFFMWASDDDIHAKSFVGELIQAHNYAKRSVLAMSGFVNLNRRGREYRKSKQIWEYLELPARQKNQCVMMDPEGFGKANYIYGIWKTKKLRAIVAGLQEHVCVDQVIVMSALLQHDVAYSKKVLFKKYNREALSQWDKIDFRTPEEGYFFNLALDFTYCRNILKIIQEKKSPRLFYLFLKRYFHDIRILVKRTIRKAFSI